MYFLLSIKSIFPKMPSMKVTTNTNKYWFRTNKMTSYYESDQEDNASDEDYNPNEYFEQLEYENVVTPSKTLPTTRRARVVNYEEDSDKEYEFEEDIDEEYVPYKFVPKQTQSTCKKMKSVSRKKTNTSQPKKMNILVNTYWTRSQSKLKSSKK
jgi:hypothetical protein